MKVNDPNMTIETREKIQMEFGDHFEVLRQIQLGIVDRATKYLLGTNGGGVIATLSFMGTIHELRQSRVAWTVLGLFLAGVILCGVQIALDFRNANANLFGWASDWDGYMQGEIGHEEVSANLNARSRRFPAAVAVGYGSFVAFIAGSALAIAGLHP